LLKSDVNISETYLKWFSKYMSEASTEDNVPIHDFV